MDPAKQTKKTLLEEWIEGKKKLFASFPSCFFFLVTNDNKWPMTTSDQWQQVFLFETSSICLPEWLCWKKKETIHWPNASEVVGEFNQKKNNIAALNWKKKLWTQSMQKKRCNKSEWKNFSITGLLPLSVTQGCFFFASQLMDCNTKKQKLWTQSMQKKKMQQVRVKKLFHYLLPLSVCHVSKGPMPGKTCRTANDYCVLLTLCFVG